MKRNTICRLLAVAGLTTSLLTACNDPLPQPASATYQPQEHFLADGDAQAGRAAFVTLQCNSCHKVAGDDIGPAVPESAAPPLGSLEAGLSAEQLAEAIVTPSHGLSGKPGPWREGNSTMTDFSGLMTVRQLIDIIAYLQNPQTR